MSYVSIQGDLTAGMWKFKSRVNLDTLTALAKEWRDSSEFYTDLHVRSWGKEQYAICFKYQQPGHFTMRKYVDDMSDKLRRQFGNDLVGWDISSPIWVIEK